MTDSTAPIRTTPTRRILVIGATGRTGRHIVDGLLEHPVDVRALVRDPSTADLPEGVELVRGDLDDPSTVAAAAKGADAAFLLWHRFTPEGSREVVSALAEHVAHIVYLSAAHLGTGPSDAPVDGVWADIEALIEDAPVTHTFVRAGGFAANTLGWAEQIRDGDTVRMPFPRAGRSLVDERDLAAVSVRGLVDPGAIGAAVTMTGPQTLTQEEQLEAIGSALGRTLVVEEQPSDDAYREYEAAMGKEFADASLAYWPQLVDRPEPPRDTRDALGRPAHTFAEWAEHHRADFEVAR